MPFFHERNFSRYKVLAALLTLVVTIALWWFEWGVQPFAPLVGMILVPSLLSTLRTRYILARGVLIICSNVGSERHIPLGSADLHRRGSHILLNWWEGYQRRKTQLHLPDSLVTELERAIHAGEKGTGPAPATQAEARRALPFGMGLSQPVGAWYGGFLLFIACLGGLVYVALWWDLPLALAPLAFLPWVSEYFELHEMVVLCGDILWVLETGKEPRSVSLDQIRRMVAAANTHRLEPADPTVAPIVLNSFRSVELIKQLKRRIG